MTTAEAIAHYGTPAALAAALGIFPQAVYQWGEFPPLGRQYQIQTLTDGKLKATPKDSAAA